VLLIGKNPDDENERVVCVIKSNLAEKPPALSFEIVEGQFRWRGETTVTPSALLGPEKGTEAHSQLEDARRFLTDLLSSGPVLVKTVMAEAKAAGIAWRTVERAKTSLRVTASRCGEAGRRGGGIWSWSLPSTSDLGRQTTPNDEVAALIVSESAVPRIIQVGALNGSSWQWRSGRPSRSRPREAG
jgi:hypothetical protein